MILSTAPDECQCPEWSLPAGKYNSALILYSATGRITCLAKCWYLNYWVRGHFIGNSSLGSNILYQSKHNIWRGRVECWLFHAKCYLRRCTGGIL